jgi:hypothetical protein
MPQQKEIPMPYTAASAELYIGKRVGTGTDVAFIQACSNAPTPGTWKEGAYIMDSAPNTIAKGTVIATMTDGHFSTFDEAAIYLGHDVRGIQVLDQWQGNPVHVRTIPSPGEGKDAAEEYCVVEG